MFAVAMDLEADRNLMNQIETRTTDWNLVDQGEGIPLLLVHGFPLDHSMWRNQIGALAQHVRVIAPDLPGFGKSRAKEPGLISMDGFANRLQELLTALGVDQPVCFCGLSMGGYIGWQFWKLHRQQLGALIACDTKSLADTPEVARARQMMARSIEKEGSQTIAADLIEKLFDESTLSQQPELIEQTRKVIHESDRDVVAGAHRAMAARPDTTSWLSEIEVPTLVAVGEHDIISTPDEMLQIANSIPNSTFLKIAGAGHMAPFEQPQAFNRAVVEFLARLNLS